MKIFGTVMAAVLFSSFQAYAATDTKGSHSIADAQDHMLTQVERELVPLAEAMPAEKYEFAPTQGSFEGVRTFSLQMSHIATVLDEFAAAILGEKEINAGQHENGPASLHGKDAVVKYLKDAFEHSHKAMRSLTPENYTEEVSLSWGKTPRAALAIESISHSMDHYGQAVVYARLNGIVPPASRKQ
jgi:uncharacterized damage-inducible protein DinB